MLTRILHNSESLCTFVEQLHLPLSQPQQRHVINLADAILVCDSKKVLTELQRQFVECVDASNMADTLRIAPWSAVDVQQPVATFLLREALACARASGTLNYLAVSVDDSLSHKHKQTRHIEGVDWHYDHVESTPHRPRYANGLVYVSCNVWFGGIGITFNVRLYLREKTVRRINRHRLFDEHIPFLSKLLQHTALGRAFQPPSNLWNHHCSWVDRISNV